MMAEDFQRSDEDDMFQFKISKVGNGDYLMPIGNSSDVFEGLEPHKPDEYFPLPQHHNLYSLEPDFNFLNNQLGVDNLVSASTMTTGKTPLWPPVDVPSSLPDECITSFASNTYDTRDYDPTDQSILGSSVVGKYHNCHSTAYASDIGDPYMAANLHMQFNFENSSASLTLDQADMLAETQSPTIIHKRKRPLKGLTEREEELDVCVESMQNDMEKMAQSFGVGFDFVIDLCLQKRAKRKSGSLYISDDTNTTNLISLSTEPANPSVPLREDLAPVEVPDASSIDTELCKRPTLNPGASHATKQEYGNKGVHCPRCGTGISRHSDLGRHLRTHDPGEMRCPYPKCKKIFNRKDKLSAHFRRIHMGDNSQINTGRRRNDDPGDDPDSGPSNRGGVHQGNKHFQSHQQETSSTNLGHSAFGGSSNGRPSQSYGNHEYFLPLLSNIRAIEFMKNFHSAQLIRKLGQGGFGQVYEFSVATRTHGNREAFACKMIRLPHYSQRAVIERARNEIRVLQVLDHPNIVAFTGAFISDKEIMISTQPVADFNLKMFLSSQLSPLSSVAKCQLWQAVGDLASAIEYIHDHGMGGGFHGDIKPENILVIQDTEIKSWTRLLLADFGSARLPSVSSASPVNHVNQAVTPRYCAPEWFTNNKNRGPASDIWSFGCVLTQIVTYLHDKTMADFEAYRTKDNDSKEDWSYCENLSAVIAWLSNFSKNWIECTGHIGRNGHIDLILDMLAPSPKDRPTAMEVVAKLEVHRKLFAEKTNRDWNYGEQLTQMHYYSHPDAIRDAKGASQSQITDALSKCGDGNTGLRLSNTKLDGSILMRYPPHSPSQDSTKKHRLIHTSMTHLNALIISNWTWAAPQVYSLEKGIEGNINSLAEYGLAMQRFGEDASQHNGVATHFCQDELLKLSSNDLALKSIDDQTPSDSFDFQQPWQSRYYLKLVPNSYKPQFQGVKFHTEIPLIKPKADSSTRNPEDRPGRWRAGRSRFSILEPATRKMREFRQRWTCQTKDSSTCDPLCNKSRVFVPSPSKTMITYKITLADYIPSFLPEFLYSRLSDSAIRNIIRQDVDFTTNRTIIEVSSGPDYPTIPIMVTEFVPSNRDFLSLSYVAQVTVRDIPKFAPSYAPPWGIHDSELHLLKKSCLSHVKSIINQGRSVGEYWSGETSIVSWRVFEVVNNYRMLSRRTAGDTTLLRKACMLRATHYFMSRITTFTRTSLEVAVTQLRSPRLMPNIKGPILTSRLLNVQIKKAMYSLKCDLTQDVLDGLGNLFAGRRKKSSWGEAFCVMLILSICVEETQVAVDAHIMAAIRKEPSRVSHSALILRESGDRVFRQIIELFHKAYKTARSSLSQAKRLGFNPIRDGFPLDESNGVTPQIKILVQDVRRIMEQYGDEIREKAKNPILEAGPDLLTHHMAFRKRNSGRLVSKFLMSFTETVG